MVAGRIKVLINGRVQGVFFRASTRDEARRLGLVGWVRNRADGAVETEAQGDEADLQRLLNWLRRGSPLAEVRKVSHEQVPLLAGEKDFAVHY
ncbi:MAG: acylphosphatase [Deltaproteobacteria bacterium]|nr:acylphosphatase [Deltaproteobacteria bacterium]